MVRTSAHSTAPGMHQAARDALELAREAHAGQRRTQSGRPFVEHSIAVADLVAESGWDGDTVAVAYLHDVLEKSDVDPETIRARFGDEVTEVVKALSEDPSYRDYAQRKRALRRQVLDSSRPAIVIYAADRLANIRDWTALPSERRKAVAAALGTEFDERLRLWEEDLAELAAHDPELPFLAELEIELTHLRADGDGRARG